VASVQPSSSIHVLTSFDGYFLGHLLYLDRLRTLALYALDHLALTEHNKQGFPFACMAQLPYNLLLMLEVLPLRVMAMSGLNFDRWFPSPRLLVAVLGLRWRRARLLGHCRDALDRYRARFDLRGGVLDTIVARTGGTSGQA
jgi:hypothetical protein